MNNRIIFHCAPASHRVRVLRGVALASKVLLPVALLALLTAASPARATTSSRAIITWLGAASDARWSNPANWQGGRVPGAFDIARFAASSSDARVDAEFGGAIGGIILEPDFAGAVRLDRALTIRGDVSIAGGTLAGEDAALWIQGAARVSGGAFVTPRALTRVRSLDIQSPGVVRLGANGKLDLTGDGAPLTGDGLLDTLTNRPNSIEYTGRATRDLTMAGPLADLARGLDGDARQPLDTPRHAPNAPNFSETSPSLVLSVGENDFHAAVIDTANGFAYFGATQSPGVVVKVRLSDFTRVGALTLSSGENSIALAVLDATNGFAYFGTSTSPGRVVKVNLTTFTRVGALTLNSGENQLTAAVIDPTNGFAYFGTSTSPGRVVKLDLATFTRTGAVTFSGNENSLNSAVIDPANGFAYFSTDTSPARVVKLNLATFTRDAALTFRSGENQPSAGVIDPARGYAYWGTNTIPGIVVRVDLLERKYLYLPLILR